MNALRMLAIVSAMCALTLWLLGVATEIIGARRAVLRAEIVDYINAAGRFTELAQSLGVLAIAFGVLAWPR